MSYRQLPLIEPERLTDFPGQIIPHQDPALALDERPVQASQIAKIMTRYASCEIHLKGFFQVFVGTDTKAIYAVLDKLKDHQLESATVSAAEHYLDDYHFAVFRRLIRLQDRPKGHRNRFAHWLTGYAENIDDAIIVWDHRIHLQTARGRKRSAAMAGQGVSEEDWREGGHLYNSACLQSIIDAYDRLDNFLYAFRQAVHPKIKKPELLRYSLMNEPEFADLSQA